MRLIVHDELGDGAIVYQDLANGLAIVSIQRLHKDLRDDRFQAL